jgi:hypothetical protein
MFIKAVVITTGFCGVLPVLFYRRYWYVHPFSDKNIEFADVCFFIFTCFYMFDLFIGYKYLKL